MLTSLEFVDVDDDVDGDDRSASSVTSWSLPDSSAAAVNDFRSDYPPDGTEKTLVSAPNRPSELLYHDYCQ